MSTKAQLHDLPPRDNSIVHLVALFRQLTANHVNTLVFSGQASRTPCDRALRRLTEERFLQRIERRMVGGARGGSGQYVYGLGRRGFYSHFTGRYDQPRVVQYHSLAIADLYVALKLMERAGQFEIAGFSTEPDCWATVGGVQLKPDFYAELILSPQERLKLWFEVDMATEAQRQLKGKLEAYWRAFNDADVSEMPVFPRTLWVAVDDERAKELNWLISQRNAEFQALFQVTTLESLRLLFYNA